MTSVRVKVLFFGMLKDIVERAEDQLELPEGSAVAAVFGHYSESYPKLVQMAGSIVPARNAQFCTMTDTMLDGDEIAFLPPVSGGSGAFLRVIEEDGHFFALTRETIDTAALARQLARPEDGAVVEFEGIVRNNSKGRATRFLDYECYEPMAVEMMARIGREIAAQYDIGRVGMIHRLGRLEIGEASVSIVVTSPHRRAAFEAALEAINRLKKLVPIWKKEYFEDGEVWVEGEWDASLNKAGSGQ
jgi:molybdopterin synthase catalytic subunit